MKQEHAAVRAARNSGDVGVLIVCLAIIFGVIGLVGTVMLVGALFTLSSGSSAELSELLTTGISYAIYLAIALSIALVSIRIIRQMNLSNMLQVEYSDYAWLRDWCNQTASELGMPRVEVFITQDPYINAYAIGFMRPYNIVLNSATIRYLTSDELKAIALHEMGHVKYHHTQISAYLSVLTNLPIVGPVIGYILDFWGRRTELTGDRLALFYLRDPALVKAALIKVHIGPDAATSYMHVTQDWQQHNSKGLFNWMSQTLVSHPFLIRRLQHIDSYARYFQQPVQSHVAPVPSPHPSTHHSSEHAH